MTTHNEALTTIKTARYLCFKPVEELVIDQAYCSLKTIIRERVECQNMLAMLPANLGSTDPECAKERIELAAMLKKQQGQFLFLITEIGFIRDRITIASRNPAQARASCAERATGTLREVRKIPLPGLR
jgi:hypothetical protein